MDQGHQEHKTPAEPAAEARWLRSFSTTLRGSYTRHAGTAALRWGKTYQEQLQQQHQQKQHALEPRGLACWPCWAGAVPPAADSCCTDICLFRISIRSDPMG